MIRRRDFFALAAGSAAGAVFTPIPWKLIDDVSIWTQNWSWIAAPPRGEIRVKTTACSLCPAGCSVRARCVAEKPIAMIAPCPAGIAGHQLPYHPARLRHSFVEIDRAVAEVRDAIARGGPVAILDGRPGRTASLIYRKYLASLARGFYVAPAPSAPGADIAAARTVLSFGVPVLDGWGDPRRVLAARRHFRLIQIEARRSRTAALADVWMPIQPGAEPLVARQLAARDFERPVAVLADPEQPEIARLRYALGAAQVRREVPAQAEFAGVAPVSTFGDIPDKTLRVLIVDAAFADTFLPWRALKSKLAPNGAVIVNLSAFSEPHADYTIAAPVYPESLQDLPPAPDLAPASYAVSAPLAQPAQGVIEPADFVLKLAGESGTLADRIQARAAAIHAARRGTIGGSPVKDMPADAFWKSLLEGNRWVDEPCSDPAPPVAAVTATPRVAEYPLTLLPFAWRQGMDNPILSKLYRESGLRDGEGAAVVHPATARAYHLIAGSRAGVTTRCGTCTVQLRVDASVAPGVVEVAAGPEIFDLCDRESDWRFAQARIWRA